MNRQINHWVSMSLLIAFAASTAAASISGSKVADVLARERGIQVAAASVQMQFNNLECASLHIASVRSIGRDLEVVIRCTGEKLPLLTIVKNAGPARRPALLAMNLAALPPAIVRRGAIVRLLMNGDRSRITIPAVCLESGREGESVRVRIPGTHRIHVARVAGSGFVIEDAA